ncbi:hypothetical protein H5410_045128 [Solanum commersonii]|uniref:R13L1/DRL21-like LRR repeat region domain-containing protein n=1 Tax=Solanum commersonii TaxID=4109 RepID=A0A9J5XBR6_SOLCO|nr:hypothetical protein H5410_045128 [Solanum commersonii]
MFSGRGSIENNLFAPSRVVVKSAYTNPPHTPPMEFFDLFYVLKLQSTKIMNDVTTCEQVEKPPSSSGSGSQFLLGGRGGLEDLGEVQSLYGSLSVLELQNVVDEREDLKEKMREKNDVEKLSLVWSESSTVDNSQTERDTKELPVTGYRGTKFSNWLADPLFLKLHTVEYREKNKHRSLPEIEIGSAR